jgi:hypothetical protein
VALLEKQMLELDISNELKRRELSHFCSTIEEERETWTKNEAGMKFTKFLTKNLRIFQLPPGANVIKLFLSVIYGFS